MQLQRIFRFTAGILLTTSAALQVEHRAPALQRARSASKASPGGPTTTQKKYTATGTPPPCTNTPYMIQNPGFEDGNFDGWVVENDTNGTVQLTSPGAYGKSKYAANLTLVWSEFAGSLSINDFPLCPANKYRFEFDYRFPTTVQGCDLSTGIGDTRTFNVLYAAAGPWKHYVMNIWAGADFEDYLQFDLECVEYRGHPTVTVLLDNFNFTHLPGSTEPNGCPRSDTYIANGGFESGNLSNWAIVYQSENVNNSVVSPGHNSDHMLQIDVHHTADPASTSFQMYRNVSNLCVGYNYSYTFDYRFQGYDTVHYPTFCNLTFEDEYCWTNVDQIDSTDSFTMLQPISEWTTAYITCENIGGIQHRIDLDFECSQVGKDPVYNFPNFTVQIDNFAVRYLPPS